MTSTWGRIQPALRLVLRPPDGSDQPTLDDLAGASHLSRFHFQRTFAGVMGESGKQFTLRVRLSQAAAALLAGTESVTDVGLRHGFGGPDTFTRAFRRRFAIAPSAYRRRGLPRAGGDGRHDGVDGDHVAAQHAQVVATVAPCVRLYGVSDPPTAVPRTAPHRREDLAMTLDITVVDAPEQHALLVRRRIAATDVAQELGQILPAVFAYAERVGAALAGPPVVRYLEMRPGSMTVEAGFPVAAPTPGEGDIEPGTLGGTSVATAVHIGPYERLSETWQVLERWVDDKGLPRAGAPWEEYVTDPGQEPDPQRWRTALHLPVG